MPPPGAEAIFARAAEQQANAGRGLTADLADVILATDHFARDAGELLYVYRNGVYVPRGELAIRSRVKKILVDDWQRPQAWTTRRAAEVVEFIRVDARYLWERPPLDVVNVENGILDLATGSLREHTPDYLSPVQLPIVFDPAADCPSWDRFIGDWFPPDSIALAWEFLALLMTPDTNQQKALLLLGGGGNGKSRYLTALRNFLGRRNVSALTLQKLESNTFAASILVGKLANICADLPSRHLTDTSTFKAIVDGNELINAERKHRDAFDFVPYARLAFSAHTAPMSTDNSEGFFDRWLVLEFSNVYRDTSDEIPHDVLDDMLVDELPGALNRARVAWLRLRETKHLSESASSRAGMDLFRSTTDPLAIWLNRATVLDPKAKVPKDDLRAAYATDCTANNRNPPTDKAFTMALKRLRPGLKEGRPTIAGEQRHCWLGIGLRAQ